MRLGVMVWSIALLAALGPRPAHAQAIVEALPAAGEAPRHGWYGWQNVLTDAGSIGLWALAAGLHDAHYQAGGSGRAYENASTGAVFVGLGVYELGGPAVHAAHGRWRNAGISLALRVALPLVSGLIAGGASLGACKDGGEACTPAAAALGAIAGGLAASTIDAAVLARF